MICSYKRLTKGQAHGHLGGVERLIAGFVSTHRDKLGDSEYTFLKRGLKRDRKNFGLFYTTPKIHKDVERKIPHPQLTHPLRPIVTTCGTALANLSKRVDHKLQQLKPHILKYIKDSDDFLRYVNAFATLLKGGKLPRNARLITADAISIYTNINTEHGLCILQLFLEELLAEGKLPDDLGIPMIMQAAKLVIVIPKYNRKIPLMLRLVDDIFNIALVGEEDICQEMSWTHSNNILTILEP